MLEMPHDTDYAEFGSNADFFLYHNRFNNMYNTHKSDNNLKKHNVSEDFGENEQEVGHRLCPTYAMNINSPLRHVRTRVYFTSESHIHALINVLRYVF